MHPVDGAARAREVAAMFARISPRYDLMNRLMTFGMDVAWRRETVETAAPTSLPRALDVGTGTGDLALDLTRRATRVMGVDFCEPMLDVGRWKVLDEGQSRRVTLLPADALHLPFRDDSFDCVTTAFTVRNVPDVVGAFREMARVLRPGGRVVCLELTPLRNRLLARAFRPYFHWLVPAVGALVTGDRDAYSYLPASVDRFPPAEALAGLMRQAGLSGVGFRRLNFGTIALHYGSK